MGKQFYDRNVLLIGALLFSAVAHFGSWHTLGWVDIEEYSRLIAEIEFSVERLANGNVRVKIHSEATFWQPHHPGRVRYCGQGATNVNLDRFSQGACG